MDAHVNDMAMAATKAKELRPKHNPTNRHWRSFGEAQGDMKSMLANLGPQAKQDRRAWLQRWAYTTMPSGPYPIMIKSFGWIKAHVIQGQYQICYIARGDLNLDVEIFKLVFAEDGFTIEARQYVEDQETIVPCRLIQEKFYVDQEAFGVHHEEVSGLSCQKIKAMIRNEVSGWKEYDKWFEKEALDFKKEIAEKKELSRSRSGRPLSQSLKAQESAKQKPEAQDKAQDKAHQEKAQEKAQEAQKAPEARKAPEAQDKADEAQKAPEAQEQPRPPTKRRLSFPVPKKKRPV